MAFAIIGKPVILTVADDPDVLRAIERDLKRHYDQRYCVSRADSGMAALDLLQRLQQRNAAVALLLVDHRMPQMNGVETLQAAMELFPRAKRTLLTAYSDTEAAIKAINDVELHHYLHHKGRWCGHGNGPRHGLPDRTRPSR